MFEATVNDHQKFQLEVEDDSILVDGIKAKLDIKRVCDGSFHIIQGSRGYSASVISVDPNEKKVKIKVNQNEYSVTIKGRMDLLLEKMGMDNQAPQGSNDIKAPMPGLILDVMVKVGEEVNKGTPLVILEAMKMENIIKSPGNARVSDIFVKAGQSVEKNHTLIAL